MKKVIYIYVAFLVLLRMVSNAQTITTYSILSTGYDRINSILLPLPTVAASSLDLYWNYYQHDSLISSPPYFYPASGTTVVSNVPAYIIDPYVGMLTDLNARYINYNSGYTTSKPYFITYRTYFNLPYPLLPANKQYSMLLKMRADDIVYDVRLNGSILISDTTLYKDSTGTNVGEAYTGNYSQYTIPYCAPAFIPGANYLEITCADTHSAVAGLSAEVALYERTSITQTCAVVIPPLKCVDCIGSFSPIPGKKYLISAWVKEAGAVQSKTSYTFPALIVQYPSVADSSGPFYASGDIIDGWQRIESEFLIPALATDLNIKLNCSSGDCFFDDIRVFPVEGSMKSYVYDPLNMRLVAELDERNYATLYDYDEEGKLIRVKKETHKGIMTIKESRNNTKK